jgi:hypothetical protein
MTRDELIDEMAITECGEQYFYCATTSEAGKDAFRRTAQLSLGRIEELINGFEDLLNGKAVIVPVTATQSMCGYGAEALDIRPSEAARVFRNMVSASPYRGTQ